MRYHRVAGDNSYPVPTTDQEDSYVNDDGNGEVIKYTDLTHEVSTDRAAWSPPLVEKSTFKASKDGIELSSESLPGSPHNKAQTTLYLSVAAAAMTLGAFWIGIPAAAAVAVGTVVTIIFYLLVHFTSGQRKRK
jgi:hypothetical protein